MSLRLKIKVFRLRQLSAMGPTLRLDLRGHKVHQRRRVRKRGEATACVGELATSACAITLLHPVARGRQVAQPHK